MTLQSSGAISFSDINTETRKSSTASGSLDSADPRITADRISTGSQISFSQFYGKTFGASTLFVGGRRTTSTDISFAAYTFSQGIGSRYSNPASFPNVALGNTYSITCSTNKSVVGFLHQSSASNRFTAIYPWSDSSGFGTRFAGPATFPTTDPTAIGGDNMVWTPSGNSIIIGGDVATQGGMFAWPWSNSTGFGTKWAQPATPHTGFIEGLAFFERFNSGSNHILIYASSSSPSSNSQSAYNYSDSTGWGTKFSAPASNVVGTPSGCVCNGFVVGIGSSQSTGSDQGAAMYNFSGSGWGSKFTSLGGSIGGSTVDVRMPFRPTGSFTNLVARSKGVGTVTPSYNVWDWNNSSGWGTVYSDPATVVGGTTSYNMSFNINIDISVGLSTSPWVAVYPWSSGWGSKYADPGTAFSPTASNFAAATLLATSFTI